MRDVRPTVSRRTRVCNRVNGSIWAGLYGGAGDAVEAVAGAYEALLNRTLAEGRLPDPESLLTQLADERSELFGEPIRVPRAPVVSPLTRLWSRPWRRDTLVTAVYDLQPSTPLGGRGYPVAWYLPTLRSVARLEAGIIVYTRPQHVEQIAAIEHRDAGIVDQRIERAHFPPQGVGDCAVRGKVRDVAGDENRPAALPRDVGEGRLGIFVARHV